MTGTNFGPDIAVGLDDTVFVAPAKVKAKKKKKKAKVTQKGALTSGEQIGQYFDAHNQVVLVTFRNPSTGGVSAIKFPVQRPPSAVHRRVPATQ